MAGPSSKLMPQTISLSIQVRPETRRVAEACVTCRPSAVASRAATLPRPRVIDASCRPTTSGASTPSSRVTMARRSSRCSPSPRQPDDGPPCHTLVGDRIYFGSGDDARKVLNLEHNPRLAVTVDLYAEDWSQIKGVMVQGTAKLVRRGPAFTRARKHLYAKYPQYSREAALSVSDSVIVEVTPTHVFTWGLD